LQTIVGNAWYRDNTSPLFKKSNILKFSDMINLNTMCILYKAYKQPLPVKLLQFFSTVNSIHNHCTRHSDDFAVKYCRTTSKSMCISIKGVKMWNSLSNELQNCETVHKFRKMYKKLILSQYLAD